MDNLNLIHLNIYEALRLETNVGGRFEGFEIYPEEPPASVLVFPSIVMSRTNTPIVEPYFGGGGIRLGDIGAILIFKQKNTQVTDGQDLLDREDLVFYYDEELRQFVDGLTFDPSLNISEVHYRAEYQYPSDKNPELFGVFATITIGYQVN